MILQNWDPTLLRGVWPRKEGGEVRRKGLAADLLATVPPLSSKVQRIRKCLSGTLPKTSWQVLSRMPRPCRVQTVSATIRGHFCEPQTWRKAWTCPQKVSPLAVAGSGQSWKTWAAPPLDLEDSSYELGINQDPHTGQEGTCFFLKSGRCIGSSGKFFIRNLED